MGPWACPPLCLPGMGRDRWATVGEEARIFSPFGAWYLVPPFLQLEKGEALGNCAPALGSGDRRRSWQGEAVPDSPSP